MGIISTTIAPTSSIAVGNTQLGHSTRGESASNANNTQNVAQPQPAAVVSISTDSKSRAASSGEKRAVDGTFEKQEGKSKTSSNKKNTSGQSGSVVNVEA